MTSDFVPLVSDEVSFRAITK